MTNENAKTVLIVEDDEEINFLLEMILKREGFVAEKAFDGLQALEKVQTLSKIDLILLDIMLPFHDGFHIVEEIRKQSHLQKTPVIMLTAKSQEQDITRALNLGANDYVIKPFQTNELVARIKRLIKS